MTPNLWRLVDPRLFFFTEFYYDSFYALYETNEGREIVVTHGQEVYGSYRVPFFQKQDPKDIFFEQITKYTTIYLLTSPSEHVWFYDWDFVTYFFIQIMYNSLY